MASETIPTETALASVSKLVQHAIKSVHSDNKEAALQFLEVINSILNRLDPYLDSVSHQGPAGLNPLIHETLHHDWEKAYSEKKVSFKVGPHWSAGAYEGGFVAMVVKALQAKRVLEVGMFTGTTTLCVADVLPSNGKIVALEIDQYFKDLVTPYFEKAGVDKRIDVRIGSAIQSMEKMVQDKEDAFDVIFIDADKPGYKNYYDTIMQGGLLRNGGVMLVDNVLYKGYTFTPELQESKNLPDMGIDGANGKAMVEFNEYVSNDSRSQVVVLPIRDGISWIMAT